MPRWALVSAGAAAVVVWMVVTSTSQLPRSADAGFARGPVPVQPQAAASGRPNSSPTADLLQSGLTLLLWLALLAWPADLLWRRFSPALAR